MELKVQDNDVLKRSKTTKSSKVVEFLCDYTYSLQFFHNIHLCQIENCSDCDNTQKRYSRFEIDLSSLQLGDEFKISAALTNGHESMLPPEIEDIGAYQPLLVACPEYYNQNTLRLPDTIEGINIKREHLEQKEKEAEEVVEKEKEVEEKRKRKQWINRWKDPVNRLNQHLKEYKPTYTLISGLLGGGLFIKYILPLFTKYLLPLIVK